MKPSKKPDAIMLSQRAHVMYLEHARVVQQDGRLLYATSSPGAADGIDEFFNIPQNNTSLLLLGKGTSVTDSAARLLASAGVMVCFCGSGGSPLHSAIEPMLLTPQSEYRPTEHMQKWVRMWVDDAKRLSAAKHFQRRRLRLVEDIWASNKELGKRGVHLTDAELDGFEAGIRRATSVESLMGAEGDWAKALYRKLANGFGVDEFKRDAGVGKSGSGSGAAAANSLLDHGNYVAYGFAAVALHALGISFALPVVHGQTRRGGLVFDVADIFKDAVVMPLAFQMASNKASDKVFRSELIGHCQRLSVIDIAIDTIKSVA
jgi:CRISPR-associated protein Cas1